MTTMASKYKQTGKPKVYYRYRLPGHHYAEQPHTVQPRKYPTGKREISRCKQKRNHISGESMGRHRV